MILELNEINLAYEDRGGSGPPLLCLHGLTGSQRTWDGIMEGLIKHHHVFTLDHRGHGESGHSPGNYSVDVSAADTAALIRKVIREPVLVWGHSMGGCVTLKLAVDYEDLVRAIVLEDPPLDSGISNEDFLKVLQFWLELGKSELSEEGMVEELARKLGDENREALRYKAKALRQMDISLIELGIEGNLWTREDALNYISGVKCPAYLMQADFEFGGLIQDDLSEVVELQSPHWSWKLYSEVAHNMHVQAPELITRDVLQFFRDQQL